MQEREREIEQERHKERKTELCGIEILEKNVCGDTRVRDKDDFHMQERLRE